jgi:hypothetical protein
MMISKKIRITAFLFLTAIFLTVGGIGTVSAATSEWDETWDEQVFADKTRFEASSVSDFTADQFWSISGNRVEFRTNDTISGTSTVSGITSTTRMVPNGVIISSVVADTSSAATGLVTIWGKADNDTDFDLSLSSDSGTSVTTSITTGANWAQYSIPFDSGTSPELFGTNFTITLSAAGKVRIEDIHIEIGEASAAAPDTWHEGFDTVAARDYSDEIFVGDAFEWTASAGNKATVRESGADGTLHRMQMNNISITSGATTSIDATSYKYGKLSIYVGGPESGSSLTVSLSSSGGTVEAMLFDTVQPNALVEYSYSFNDVDNSELFGTDFKIIINSMGKSRCDEIHLQLSLTPIPIPELVLNSGATTSSVAAGDDAEIAVQLYDSANEVQEDLTGVSPQLSLTRSSGITDMHVGVLNDPVNGQVTFTISGVSTVAGVTETITVTSNVTDWETSNTIVIETVPDDAATVVITGPAVTQPDIAIELTGSASDAYGNAITDLSGFAWSTDLGTVTPASGATTSFVTSTPGNPTVTLTAPSAAFGTHPITVSGTIGSLELVLDPTDPVAAGSDVTVTATLYDEPGTTPQGAANVDDIILTRESGATEVGTAGGTGEIVFVISSVTGVLTETVTVDSYVANLNASATTDIVTICRLEYNRRYCKPCFRFNHCLRCSFRNNWSRNSYSNSRLQCYCHTRYQCHWHWPYSRAVNHC